MTAEEVKKGNYLIESHILSFGRDNPNGYEAYKKLLAPMVSIESTRHHSFESTIKAYIFKDMVLASTVANTQETALIRHSRLASLPGNDSILVFFCRTQSIRIKTDTLEAEALSEQPVLVDMSKPFSIHATGIDMLALRFPRSLLEPLIPGVQGIHGSILADGPHKELLAGYMKTMEAVAAQIQASHSVHVTETVVRMIANCLLHTGMGKSTSSAANIKLNLTNVKNAIDLQIDNPQLSLEMLMEQFHVSRSTLYRMFEPHGGVAKYIQTRKLDFAYRELSKYADKKQNISMLAYKLGYSHASVFTRAFFNRFGVNPSEVRTKFTKK